MVFVQSKKFDILKKIRKRKNYNKLILNKFRKIQLPLAYKRNKSQFVIKNNFTSQSVKKDIQYILNKI